MGFLLSTNCNNLISMKTDKLHPELFHKMVTLSSFKKAFTVIGAIFICFSSAGVSGLGSASTIAVSYDTKTVCGILAGNTSQKIQCYRQGRTISIQPNKSYESLSGGNDFFCALNSGGSILHCWDTSFSNRSFHSKLIYNNSAVPLTDLTVGDSQVCALQAATGRLQCWERGSSWFWFPKGNAPAFQTITSGGGFSCGIVKDDRLVSCWGENGIGDDIESQFGNMSMLSLVAGKHHVCGLTISGILICKGSNDFGQLDAPPNVAFQYSGIALGLKQSCAIESNNGKVVCWGGGSRNSSGFITDEIKSLSFELIVAGLDFTCGLTRENLVVICWGAGWPRNADSSINVLPLSMVVPGPCVQDICGICGTYRDSKALCSSTANICKLCVIQLPPLVAPTIKPPMQPPIKSPIQQPPPPILELNSSPSTKEYRPFWAYEIFGSLGIISGLWALVFCIRNKRSSGPTCQRYQDSSEPGNAAIVTAHASSAPESRSSSIIQSSSLTLSNQMSWSKLKLIGQAKMIPLPDLAAATNNFSSEYRIGSGSFGVVYKGKLADGQEVAIKRKEIAARRKKSEENETAFDSELALLSRVHHKHLVGLVGFCLEKDERLLVYEYMSNGALHHHLHGTNEGSSAVNSWRMRIKIALDTARGIEYLHNYAVPSIIHRDIKSSNILLDSNWTARVSDFGLSLMGPESDHEEGMEVKAVGTIGYIDPEYYLLKVLTTKSDVYGFGVVLLELLTGKRAVFRNERIGAPTGVVEHATPFIVAGEVWKVLDRRVGRALM
ncbi:hypothetical protein Nepgr_000182 [Nepenthes gracilis]|uniref:Protein kinase domain-containing protein n=1 Tax=Nepenthes gracilis TaxID=150966 RepID=A0AAD3P4U5_NEPGR|nr:hypothetical protein Nepgr_000182 [Nepenthes gracilis]